MRRGLIIGCLIGIVLAAIVIVGGGLPRSADDRERAVYAYGKEQEFVVMREGRVLARVSRVSDLGDPGQNKVVWTNGGRHLALLSDATIRQEGASTTDLIVVDARNGAVKRLPCPHCWDITPVAQDAILARDNETDPTFRRFDLDAGGGNVDEFEPGPGFLLSFLASTSDAVVTNRGMFVQGDYRERLSLTTIDGGSPLDLGSFSSNDYMPAAMTGSVAKGSARVAVAFRENPGECAARFPIWLFSADKSGRSGEPTDMSATWPPGYADGAGGGVEVNDLWWGRDGKLYATIASWTCDDSGNDEGAKMRIHRRSTIWKLDGTTWVSEGGNATAARDVDADTKIILVRPDCIGTIQHADPVVYCNKGTLYREHDHARTRVATQVVWMTAPP